MGDWLWGSWLALDFQFPMLILRSVGSEQISRENYPFPVHLQLNQMWGYPYRTALWLEKTFLQATPQRLRILMSGPMRATKCCQDLHTFQGTGHCPRPLSLRENPFQGALGLPLTSQGLNGQNFSSECLLAPNSTTPDLGIWTTIITPLAIWVGEGSVSSLSELKRLHSLI